MCPESSSQIAPKWPHIEKNGNDATIFQSDVIAKFFWCCFVSLVEFSFWSRFHANIVTDSEVKSFFL